MTLVGVNMRRALQLLLAVVLVLGATSFVTSQRADASFPGGNQWIAFVGDGDLWVINADGTNLTQLTTNGLNQTEADPVFSADGNKLAYALDPGSGDSAVYVADFLNGNTSSPSLGAAKQISAGPIDGAPTWSPDGTQVAYQRRALVATGTATSADAAGVTLTDTAATFVTDGVAAGDLLTNTSDGFSNGVVASVDSETQVTLVAKLAGGTVNDWGVGDAYIIRRPNRQIFKSPANGSNKAGTRLSPAGSDTSYTDESPAWSPDGTKIAFVSTQDNANSDILKMNPDGSGRSNLTTAGTLDAVASSPSWSPDGARIAFQTSEAAGRPSDNNENIWTITAAGAGEQQVTASTDNEVEPAWSPDGDLIAYRRADTGGDKLYAIASDGSGSAARIGSASVPTTNGAPDWRPGPENPPVVTVAGPAFGAPGQKASFSSTVTDGSGSRTYAWSVTRGSSEVATGTTATLDFTPGATGAYTVSLTVTDEVGTDTDAFDFTVMTDISSSVFVGDIVWLANEGITKGCNPPTNDQYCPNDNVTRGQMAAFLVRFLGLTDDGGGNLFADDNGNVFEHNIDILATAGITKGCNPPANTSFCPNDNVTRGQMAAFLVRALGLTDDGGGNLFTDDNGNGLRAQHRHPGDGGDHQGL